MHVEIIKFCYRPAEHQDSPAGNVRHETPVLASSINDPIAELTQGYEYRITWTDEEYAGISKSIENMPILAEGICRLIGRERIWTDQRRVELCQAVSERRHVKGQSQPLSIAATCAAISRGKDIWHKNSIKTLRNQVAIGRKLPFVAEAMTAARLRQADEAARVWKKASAALTMVMPTRLA